MKKLIAILAILVVLVGAAFASDTHTLNVSCTITPVVPQFALGYSTARSNTNTAYSTTTASYAISTETVVAAAGADIVDNNSITVYAYVLNAARQKQTYTLTFSGGKFDSSVTGCTSLKIDGAATVVTPDISTASSIASNTAVKGLNKVTATGETLSVPFNGSQMNATAETELGSATYDYGDLDWTTIDPGTYTTNIILTITT